MSSTHFNFRRQSLETRRPRSRGCLLLLVLGVIIFQPLFAQTKSVTTENQVWLGYFNQTRFSNHWGIWAEGQLRTRQDFVDRFSQGIARVGLMYYLSDDAKLTAGYAFVNHFPADNHKNISQPEHRPWQQLQWHTKYPSLRLMQWFRLEERFRRKIKNNDELAEGYLFNFRLRYHILAQFPLSKKKFVPGTVSLVFSNETFVNFGKQVINNYFDQNRFTTALQFQLNKTSAIQAGYMHVFQQLPAGNVYRQFHNARIFYFHNLDGRRSASNSTGNAR